MKNKTTQEQLIELYEQQIQDLVMMSKIELGDDVIAKIKELKSQTNKQQTAVEWLNQRRIKNGFNTMEDFQQAKEIEKQQIIYAWNSAYGGDSHHDGKDFFEEEYRGNK